MSDETSTGNEPPRPREVSGPGPDDVPEPGQGPAADRAPEPPDVEGPEDTPADRTPAPADVPEPDDTPATDDTAVPDAVPEISHAPAGAPEPEDVPERDEGPHPDEKPAEAPKPIEEPELVEDREPALPADDTPTDPDGIPTVVHRQRRRTPSRSQVLVAVLLAVLGFSVVVQARQTQEHGLASLRQSDLVRIFDDLQQRSARLADESSRLQETQNDLRSGTDRQAAAEKAARERLEVLGILAGTLPATGPGIRLDVTDPDRRVSAAMLLDTVQELRDAGAEAIQIGDVRVVANTWFVDGPDGVTVDGQDLKPPYRFVAIGESATMASALDIPGGVLEIIRSSGAKGTVKQSDSLTVSALRQVKAPQYAQPAPARSP